MALHTLGPIQSLHGAFQNIVDILAGDCHQVASQKHAEQPVCGLLG